MQLVNHTPFPAMTFLGVDQNESGFHVVLLRQTLSFASGKLEYTDSQSPLCELDMPFSAESEEDVRCESDLVPFKPKCDVIVNATAYAPAGKPLACFDVSLRITSSNGATSLLDKKLTVYGERQFERRSFPVRAVRSLLGVVSLGAFRLQQWKLTDATPFFNTPLRYRLAYGGQYRMYASDPAARRLPARHRLEDSHDIVAHTVFDYNPTGVGYVPAWILKATKRKFVPAPRLERPGNVLTAKMFCDWQHAATLPQNENQNLHVCEPAGFGIRPKTHPRRAALLGTVDDEFVRGGSSLPSDFDFAYYNAAPPDQQLSYLRNDELIELHNLCPPTTPGATESECGDVVLRLPLLQHECFALLKLEDGRMCVEALALDTVLIEPDDLTIGLVWRLAFPCDVMSPVLSCETRMWSHEERNRVRAKQQSLALLKELGRHRLDRHPDEGEA